MPNAVLFPDSPASPPNGWVWISSRSPALSVRSRMGRQSPLVTAGYGGWQTDQRARRTSLTQWQGREPYQMSLTIMLDGWKEGVSIEDDIRSLERMATPPQRATPPPVVRLRGNVPHADLAWVITGLDVNTDSILYNRGRRARSEYVITLLQYVADDLASDIPPIEKAKVKARTHGAPGGAGSHGTGKPDIVTVARGTTLAAVAANVYGDASRWHDIADANDIRDPKFVPPDVQLILP